MNLINYVDFIKSRVDKVKEFHSFYGHPLLKEPLEYFQDSHIKRLLMRYELIFSEFSELYASQSLLEKLDAVVDVQYVVYGMLIEFGLTESFIRVIQGEPLEFPVIYNQVIITDAAMFLTNIFSIIEADEAISSLEPRAFDMIHENNMSKYCNTLDEVADTLTWYANKGIHADYGVRVRANRDVFVIYRDDGKVLKPVHFTPVDLKVLVDKT